MPALVTALRDDSAATRHLAAEFLGQIGPPAQSAVPALSTALDDDDDVVATAAADAIKSIVRE